MKGGQRPTLAGVQNQVRSICSAQHLKSILKTEVKPVRRGLELSFSTDQAALDRLCRVQLGKTILFTDNADWSDEDMLVLRPGERLAMSYDEGVVKAVPASGA